MKLRDVTYLGRRAKVTNISTRGDHTTGIGERVSILVWIDDATKDNGGHTAGTVVASHIKGDGRRINFQRFAEKTFTNLDDALNWAESRLGTRLRERTGVVYAERAAHLRRDSMDIVHIDSVTGPFRVTRLETPAQKCLQMECEDPWYCEHPKSPADWAITDERDGLGYGSFHTVAEAAENAQALNEAENA